MIEARARTAAAGENWLAAVGFIGLAVILRLPALLYSVLNFDESLYLLIGDGLANGVLPYTGICDRKPFGLFAIFALFALSPFDALVTSRIAASVSIGLTAFLLSRIAARLFDDDERWIGRIAGLTYVLYTLVDGGLASNAEVFHITAAVLGLHLVLRAIEADPARPRIGLMAAAGLAMGVGIQIKQPVVFDMAAFAIGYLILTTTGLRRLGGQISASLPALAAVAAGAVTPTLLVMLVYVATGHWTEWVAGNVAAQRGFVDDRSLGFEIDPALRAMAEQAPLWLVPIVAALSLRRLARSAGEERSGAFLLVWVLSIVVAQYFLRIAADHYFLQFLPAFSLLTGLLLGRGIIEQLPAGAVRAGALTTIVVLTWFGIAKTAMVNTAYVLRDRYIYGEAHAADTPAQVAAFIKPQLRPDDTLYQIGFHPILYHLTGAEPPTRFAFTGLPHRTQAGRDGCPWVEPAVEAQRVLDTRPRFVAVEQGAFWDGLEPAAKSVIQARLDRDYTLRASFPMHWIHQAYPFERFVNNAAGGSQVWELRPGSG